MRNRKSRLLKRHQLIETDATTKARQEIIASKSWTHYGYIVVSAVAMIPLLIEMVTSLVKKDA